MKFEVWRHKQWGGTSGYIVRREGDATALAEFYVNDAFLAEEQRLRAWHYCHYLNKVEEAKMEAACKVQLG